MKRNIVAVFTATLTAVVLFPIGWYGGRLVTNALSMGRTPTQASTGDKTVAQAALDAFNRGDYAAALPLFKQWASMPDVRNDPTKQAQAMAYIIETEKRIKEVGSVATSAPAPVDQARLMQQATALALASQNTSDIPTGADRVLHKPIPRGQTVAMTIKELANFEFDPVNQKAEDVPADVRALDGSHLRLTGYMIPVNQADEITKFALVPSLVSCCYGQPPGVQHVITVTMAPGKSVDYSLDELEVEGTLHINVQRQDGYTYQIFEFTGDSAKLKE